MRATAVRLAVLAGSALAILIAAQADYAAASLFYDAGRGVFPLRDTWLFAVAGHTGLKWAMAGFWAFCLVRGGAWRRGAAYMAAIAVVVALLKHFSPYSCPWDLAEFGGSAAQTGRCLPAAHPVSGFALFGLYGALRSENPRSARAALAAAWLVGLAAGMVQVARGAHFPSHVLWTAWVAWAVTLALAAAPRRRALA